MSLIREPLEEGLAHRFWVFPFLLGNIIGLGKVYSVIYSGLFTFLCQLRDFKLRSPFVTLEHKILCKIADVVWFWVNYISPYYFCLFASLTRSWEGDLIVLRLLVKFPTSHSHLRLHSACRII